MAGWRVPGPLGRNPEPQDLNDGTMFRGLSPLPGPIGAGAREMHDNLTTASEPASDIWHRLQLLREAGDLTTIRQVAVHILAPHCFSVGVIVGISETIISSVVDLVSLCRTLVLADLHDLYTGQTCWSCIALDSAYRSRKMMATLAGILFPDELRKAAEERDALIRELTEAIQNPLEAFAELAQNVVAKYKKDWEDFKTHMTANTLEGWFHAGRIFGRVVCDIFMVVLNVVGAVRIIARLPRLFKYMRRKAPGGGIPQNSTTPTPATEPLKTETPKKEAPRTEPRKNEPQTEASREEAPRTEPKKNEPHTEAPREEAPRTEPKKNEPQTGAPREEAPRTEPEEKEPRQHSPRVVPLHKAIRTVERAFKEAGIGRARSPAWGLLTHADGTVTVALSGDAKIAGGVRSLWNRLRPKLPPNYRLAEPDVEIPNYRQGAMNKDGTQYKGDSSSCVEPRLAAAERENPSPVVERTEFPIWRGSTRNPHPHPDNPRYMNPCPSCELNMENINRMRRRD
jgi:hypothetical protein